MKKALIFSGIFLSISAVYAADAQRDVVAEGRKRNEQAYEKQLEQTGWKNQQAQGNDNSRSPQSHETGKTDSQPKSS